MVTTAASAKDTSPNLEGVTTGAAALIKGADTSLKLGTIEYRFKGLANDAETRAQYLKIQELLPAVNADIKAWRSNYTKDKPFLPQSDNIYALQGLLGITGNDRDKTFGPQTARSLTYLASTPVGRYGDDKLPKLGLEGQANLSAHIQSQAPKAYANYLEDVGETRTKAVTVLTEKLEKEGDRATKLTKLAFESCTGEQLALDKDAFVRSIVGALNSEAGKIDSAIEVACKDILDLASPEQRGELLSSLQENLAKDITRMRSVVQTETEKVQLRALIEKYPSAALKDVIQTRNNYPDQTGP